MSDYLAENVVQPITDDFSTDGFLDDFARIDHQHPLSPTLRAAIYGGTSVGRLNKNLIDNGAMNINQRTGASAGVVGPAFLLDRWQLQVNTLGTWTISQTLDAPANTEFTQCSKLLVTTANAAPAASSLAVYSQLIEGLFLQHLLWGTPSAKSITLSFWVKSTTVGTYIAELYRTEATVRNISKTFTINTANTWEFKTIVIPGDTTTLITNDTNARLSLFLWLASSTTYNSGVLNTSWNNNVAANRSVGQVNLAATVNNFIEFTGIQLEIGSAASFYETKRFDDELRKCMRYYEKSYEGAIGPGAVSTAGAIYGIARVAAATQADPGPTIWFKVRKRLAPTMLYWRIDGVANAWVWGGAAAAVNTFRAGENSVATYSAATLVGLTIGQAILVEGHWTASCEI